TSTYRSALSVCRRESDDADCDFLNRIVAVAEPVPFGMFGLNSACTVRCTRTQHSWPGSVDTRHQLPALPRLPARFADKTSTFVHLHCPRFMRHTPSADQYDTRGPISSTRLES